MTKILLNPFSISLGKNPFVNITVNPCYVCGDFRIYKLYENHFLHTFKNIIFAERCAKNTDLIHNLIDDIIPQDEAKKYHNYERPKHYIKFGIEQAEKLNFEVI